MACIVLIGTIMGSDLLDLLNAITVMLLFSSSRVTPPFKIRTIHSCFLHVVRPVPITSRTTEFQQLQLTETFGKLSESLTFRKKRQVMHCATLCYYYESHYASQIIGLMANCHVYSDPFLWHHTGCRKVSSAIFLETSDRNESCVLKWCFGALLL